MRAVLALVLAALSSSTQPALTPFELGDQGGIIVSASLNGRGPFRLLLDTGSTHSALSEGVATAIGAPIVARSEIGSVLGRREALVVQVDTLECGPLVARGVLASILPFDELGTGEGIQGVIGQDVLAPLRYTIDFLERRLIWWHGEEPAARGITLSLQPSEGRFLISLPQRRDVLRLVPDSGAATFLLFDEGRKRVPLTLLPDRATLTTMSSRKTVRLARMRELHVGRTILRDVAAVVVGRSTAEPGEADGLLPLHLFDRVTFDGPRGVLILEGSALGPA